MNENIETEGVGITITSGFPGAVAEQLSRAERLARRAALNTTDAERALTRIIADLSGLAADETLFRHDHPAELADAALVRLTGEVAEASPDHRGLTVRFAGREVASGTILPGALTALGKLPVKWLTAEGGALTAPVTVAELKLLKPATFGDAFVGGRKAATFEAELYARICVSLPRGDGATS